MTKNKKKGIILILSPWIIMAVNYLIYYLLSSVFDNTAAGYILQIVLGLIAMLNIIWIFAGTIIGIVFLAKTEKSAPTNTK